MTDAVLPVEATLASLPPKPSPTLRAATRASLSSSSSSSSSANAPLLIVLDDDPTGTQTCHDIHILTAWDVPRLVAEFKATPPGSGFFLLTNSRALHPAPARALITEICTNLQEAERQTGLRFEVVLRSDSTLRGHFPLEADASEDVLGPADAWILCPFFLQGGRYTIGNVHYVQEGANLVPAAQTPFARDATFGYTKSDLCAHVVEKAKGAIKEEQVSAVSLDTIRNGGAQAVLQQIQSTIQSTKRPVIVINAAADEDVDVVVEALLTASAAGTRFLYRTGAAFVSARLAIEGIPPVSAQKLGLSGAVGGLIIAGSYVPKTTAQLAVLRERSGAHLTTVVLDVRRLLSDPDPEIRHALETASGEIARGQDVLIMTSRELVLGADEARSLDIGATVARALVSFLQRLETKPRYVVAKGGITSSDMATQGLRFKRALIVGQAAPGVPLWRCDEPEAKWPGLPYVVFPGNVGSEETLFDVVHGWRVS
ncbi:uncharacterized protein F5Z01DRAFT_633671 [Emericellopsis atlantica]|uniref:Uncharacterized protein n=1 Tax=Emericellopsis atlantica TaxID=2614577 RepID=A0A9P8CT16_9HYPO|nr:uncharacterized protein F5Z01DRAFT_633671 [Emericellopsis atlantica]KAG9257760.1 hypothetical protein F5Z01DRAFT_633671 [Emericellopsis atlantica]